MHLMNTEEFYIEYSFAFGFCPYKNGVYVSWRYLSCTLPYFDFCSFNYVKVQFTFFFVRPLTFTNIKNDM